MIDEASFPSLPRGGDRLGRYTIVTPIGYGGTAAVYAARMRSLGGVDKVFALKVLLPHLQREREYVEMFLDEARITSQLDHPNVAAVFELGEHEGAPYMVMEYLRGQALSSVLRRASERSRALPIGVFLRIIEGAAEGLHGAHEARGADGQPMRVVHRDVSPQNIHVGYDGRVRVVDFGIARARGRATHTVSGEIKGKLRYLSPEQVVSQRDVDRRADLWALGVMLWEQYAGRSLFKEEDDPTTLWNLLHREVPPVRTVAPDVPSEMAALIAKCLERNAAARPASALEVARVLRRHADAAGASAEDVAREMEELFARERVETEERLAAALGISSAPAAPATSAPPPPAPSAPPAPAIVASDPHRAPARAAGRGWLVALAAVVVAVAAFAAVRRDLLGAQPEDARGREPVTVRATEIASEVGPRAPEPVVDAPRAHAGAEARGADADAIASEVGPRAPEPAVDAPRAHAGAEARGADADPNDTPSAGADLDAPLEPSARPRARRQGPLLSNPF